LHQFLGKGLAGLYPGGGSGRPEDGDAYLPKAVDNALGQRPLRPDDDQFNALLLSYFSQRLDVSRLDIQVDGDLSRAGVARSGINLFNLGALGQLPDQGMLPGPAPDNQYLYLIYLRICHCERSEAIPFLSASPPLLVCHCESPMKSGRSNPIIYFICLTPRAPQSFLIFSHPAALASPAA